MTDLFLKLLNMSINAGWLVLAVMLLRLLFRNAPKWLFPALWSLVGLRLLLPETLECKLSLVPQISNIGTVVQAAASSKPHSFASYMGIVWCVGMAAMLLYEIISYFWLRTKLKTAVRLSANIYQSEYVKAPFIIGLFAPRIYLPFHIGKQELDSVIAHERAHIKRLDHCLKPMAFLLLSIYWFDPLLWAAYFLLCKDIELACDEYAIKNMDDSQRVAYSQVLLSCTASQRIITACPLAFGSKDVKKRILSVLAYQKPHTWVMVVTAALVLLFGICFMTNPKHTEKNIPSIQGEHDIAVNDVSDLNTVQSEQSVLTPDCIIDQRTKNELESLIEQIIYRERQTFSHEKNN